MSRFLGSAIALVALSAATAPAEVVLNTLTSQLDGTVAMTADNNRRYAQSFTTSATAESLTEISLDLSATGTTSFDVQIWSNNPIFSPTENETN